MEKFVLVSSLKKKQKQTKKTGRVPQMPVSILALGRVWWENIFQVSKTLMINIRFWYFYHQILFDSYSLSCFETHCQDAQLSWRSISWKKQFFPLTGFSLNLQFWHKKSCVSWQAWNSVQRLLFATHVQDKTMRLLYIYFLNNSVWDKKESLGESYTEILDINLYK